ncbi:hypothetical protein F2Q70_00031367 [Brassica cretica]|uniref:Uncharacterized protein n=1 Tax=Brassica cretica TaxID=69181 RepID=A0A8S9FJF9_BRACR|nr:hypothetical protein F2Q70_00031367 [Brassica cretica]
MNRLPHIAVYISSPCQSRRPHPPLFVVAVLLHCCVDQALVSVFSPSPPPPPLALSAISIELLLQIRCVNKALTSTPIFFFLLGSPSTTPGSFFCHLHTTASSDRGLRRKMLLISSPSFPYKRIKHKNTIRK